MDKETTLTTDFGETTTGEVLVRAFRGKTTDFKVSNMILKVCKVGKHFCILLYYFLIQACWASIICQSALH